MSNQKRGITLSSLSVGIAGKLPPNHNDSQETRIEDESGAKTTIVGGLDEDGILRPLLTAADGTLQTSAVMDGDIVIGDIKVGSNDGVSGNEFLRTDGDGHLLNHVLDSSDSIIDPATEATLSTRALESGGNLDDIKTNTNNLDVALSTLATEATLGSIDSKLNSLGQKLSAGSVPVVIASDQSSIPVTPAPANSLNTDMGVSAFDLSSGDTEFDSIDVSNYVRGSAQFVWSGATSSDGFTSQGTFTVQISNDDATWNDLFSVAIDDTDGDILDRGLDVDFRFIRAIWVQNNSTGGDATVSATFKFS